MDHKGRRGGLYVYSLSSQVVAWQYSVSTVIVGFGFTSQTIYPYSMSWN